jgi:hypothetical protein
LILLPSTDRAIVVAVLLIMTMMASGAAERGPGRILPQIMLPPKLISKRVQVW